MTPDQLEFLKREVTYQRGLVVNLQSIANGAEVEPVLRIAETSLFTALDRAFDDMVSSLEAAAEGIDLSAIEGVGHG